MSKHTPGPWKVDSCGIVRDTKDKPIKHASAFIEGVYYDDDATEESTANAHIIAAAPDLLEVCETLLKRWESSIIPDAEKLSYCVAMLRAAINKAKGETNVSTD